MCPPQTGDSLGTRMAPGSAGMLAAGGDGRWGVVPTAGKPAPRGPWQTGVRLLMVTATAAGALFVLHGIFRAVAVGAAVFAAATVVLGRKQRQR